MTIPGSGELDLGLGKNQDYVDQYTPELLRSIPRTLSRDNLGLSGQAVPFTGIDLWTAFEVSWLDDDGKPVVAIAEIRVPADSESLIESKSLKYYLNSFNQTPVKNRATLQAMVEADLSHAAGSTVGVQLFGVDEYQAFSSRKLKIDQSICIDDLAVGELNYTPSASLLKLADRQPTSRLALQEEHVLKTHLLKSNCPVTGQPDWATLWVGYKGQIIKPESLLAYVISFRQHDDFHENCVEKIFCDVTEACQPTELWVYARYTRRGGLDINPFRSSLPMPLPRLRGPRQ